MYALEHYQKICKEFKAKAKCLNHYVKTEYGTYVSNFKKGDLKILVVFQPEAEVVPGEDCISEETVTIWCFNEDTMQDLTYSVSDWHECYETIAAIEFILDLIP